MDYMDSDSRWKIIWINKIVIGNMLNISINNICYFLSYKLKNYFIAVWVII